MFLLGFCDRGEAESQTNLRQLIGGHEHIKREFSDINCYILMLRQSYIWWGQDEVCFGFQSVVILLFSGGVCG